MSGLIQQGKHPARADKTSYELGEDQNGKPFAFLSFDIIDGPDKGRTIGGYFYLTDAAKDYSIEKLRNAGASFPGGDIFANDGIGDSDCQIVVEHEEYNGKTSAKIKFVNKRGGGGVKAENKLSDGGKQRFRDMFKADLLATGSKPKSAEGPPKIDDSDAPF